MGRSRPPNLCSVRFVIAAVRSPNLPLLWYIKPFPGDTVSLRGFRPGGRGGGPFEGAVGGIRKGEGGRPCGRRSRNVGTHDGLCFPLYSPPPPSLSASGGGGGGGRHVREFGSADGVGFWVRRSDAMNAASWPICVEVCTIHQSVLLSLLEDRRGCSKAWVGNAQGLGVGRPTGQGCGLSCWTLEDFVRSMWRES